MASLGTDLACAFAATTKVETPEGGVALKGLVGKAVALLAPGEGHVRFRLADEVRQVAEAVPLLRVSLATGAVIDCAASQEFVRADGAVARADRLVAGDALAPAYSYPAGYRYRDDDSGEERDARAEILVGSIEPRGQGDVFGLALRGGDRVFLNAGVLVVARLP
jgi:hypothetical protein